VYLKRVQEAKPRDANSGANCHPEGRAVCGLKDLNLHTVHKLL